MDIFNQIIIKALPIIIAITLHEAAHGYVAYYFGDNTAMRAGRITLNPLRHIDPIGTVFLPAILLISGAPFLFGYAKPVPVNFARLNQPRWHSIYVAAAGPGMNLILALLSAILLRFSNLLPLASLEFIEPLLITSIMINVVLAVFNLIPLPPLDGGRIAMGLLPRQLAGILEEIEPYGVLIIFLLLLLPSFVGDNFNIIFLLIEAPVKFILKMISIFTGI